MSSRKLKASDLKGLLAVEWAKGRIAYLKARAAQTGMTQELRAQIKQARELLRKEAR